jgi:hypothetical protein
VTDPRGTAVMNLGRTSLAASLNQLVPAIKAATGVQRVYFPARGPARVIGQSHRGAAKYVDIGYHAALSQPVTEPTEGLLDALTIEEGRGFAHAASIS